MYPAKATGPSKIQPKIIQLPANIIDSHFTNIINKILVITVILKNAKKLKTIDQSVF